MRVLMFGWENSPVENSGLGVACSAIMEALKLKGADVTLITPSVRTKKVTREIEVLKPEKRLQSKLGQIKTHFPKQTTYYTVGADLRPYQSAYINRKEGAGELVKPIVMKAEAMFDAADYSESLSVSYMLQQVEEYSLGSQEVIENGNFDIIYAHDWMSFKAGVLAKEMLGIPLVLHVHSTEFDRSVFNPIPEIVKEEFEGLKASNHVIAVSEKSATKLKEKYGVSEEKVTVVHTGLDQTTYTLRKRKVKKKYMTFVGRMEYQKGPGYFVDMAAAIANDFPDLQFMMIGEGSLLNELKSRVEKRRLSNRFIFSDVVSQQELNKILRKTIIMYQPAIHEPYGLAAIEAVCLGVPVIVSKGTGMSESVPSMIEVDYWDQYNNKIILKNLIKNRKKLDLYSETCADEARSNSSLVDAGGLLIDTFAQFV